MLNPILFEVEEEIPRFARQIDYKIQARELVELGSGIQRIAGAAFVQDRVCTGRRDQGKEDEEETHDASLAQVGMDAMPMPNPTLKCSSGRNARNPGPTVLNWIRRSSYRQTRENLWRPPPHNATN